MKTAKLTVLHLYFASSSLTHQNWMISFSSLKTRSQRKLLVWMDPLFCCVLLKSPFHYFQICSSGYLLFRLPRFSYTDVDRLSQPLTLCDPPAHTTYANMQCISRLWFQKQLPNFHSNLGTNREGERMVAVPKILSAKLSAFQNSRVDKWQYCQIMGLPSIKHP